MSEDERVRKDSIPRSDEIPRPDSSSSSVISKTSSPEHLQEDVSVEKQESLKQEDPEKVSADVAARGILNPRKFPEGVAQSGMRGMLIAACEVRQDNSENSQETGDQQMTQESGPVPEEVDSTSREIYFFNKDSLTNRRSPASRGAGNPGKSSGPQTPSGICATSENTHKTDEVPESDKGELEVNKDTGQTPKEIDPTSQEIIFFNKDSSSSRPSSASSTSSAAGDREKREVFFQATDEDMLKKEKSFVSYTDNKTIEVVSICTQTEWSWFNDMLLYQEMMARTERTERRASRDVPKSPSVNSHAGSIKRRRRKSLAGSRRASVSSEKSAQMKDEDNTSLPELDEGQERKLSLAGVEGGSTGRSKSKSSGGVPRSRQSIVSSLPRTPKGEDILFRPTTVEPDSSSDSEDYENYDLEREYLLPSIGPPTILQYMKESQHPPMSNEEVEDRKELAKNEMLKKSMFSGPCMFCHEEILPFPTLDELERLSPDQLYCCPQYERLVKFELAQRTDSGHLTDEMIDIKPHAPYGTKAARRAAKERAAERAREREMERQRAAGANPTNFYALTRQMKTITYSLASTKCMEEGWTVRPESPSSIETEQWQDPFVIEVNPLPLRKQAFLERFYDNKRSKRFLLLLPDGTGTCYYPSGNIAVMITATEKGKFTYIVFDDDEENEKNPSRMLAIFEPSGHGTCYFRDGRVRLVLNPFYGVLLDHRGTRKKKWLWHNLKEHVHAPPFQPVTFMITKELSIRCLSQNKTVLTFNHGKYTARFNVGSKLKAVARAKPPSSRDSYETHLAEVKQFVNIVLDRYQNAMRLPNYPRLDKIPLPLHLQRTKDSGRKTRLQGSSPSRQRETTVIVN